MVERDKIGGLTEATYVDNHGKMHICHKRLHVLLKLHLIRRDYVSQTYNKSLKDKMTFLNDNYENTSFL